MFNEGEPREQQPLGDGVGREQFHPPGPEEPSCTQVKRPLQHFIRQKLAEFNERLPKYPADDDEWRRRYSILLQDPIAEELSRQYEEATEEARKTELYWELSERRREVLSSEFG